MTDPIQHPMAMDGKDIRNLRGDPIDAERYFSRDFMKQEWDQLWTKIWHIAGRESQLEEAGDYLVHTFMRESVIIAKQHDGSLKGMYNVCAHRAQRLVWDSGSLDQFFCPYHGWTFDLDGTLIDLPDRDDYPQGDPCGKVNLIEVRVATWGGFVWYTMDDDAPELLDYLAPLPDLYKNHPMEKLLRVKWVKVDLDCNWKFWSDNFNESYHTRTAHKQVAPTIDQDHFTSRYEMFPNGHARIIQMGRPSLRDRVPAGEHHPFDDVLRAWDIDPDQYPDYETKAMQGWRDLKDAKKRLWKEKGHLHYEHMNDEDLTESPFTHCFPNISFGTSADGVALFRWEPHPTDPEKCVFDYWVMTYPIEGEESHVGRTATVAVDVKEAELEHMSYDGGKGITDESLIDSVVYQDWSLNAGQTEGWHSRGYQEPYMAAQESRVRKWHENLNDYLAGNPPGR